jgi:hypothetical protein
MFRFRMEKCSVPVFRDFAIFQAKNWLFWNYSLQVHFVSKVNLHFWYLHKKRT